MQWRRADFPRVAAIVTRGQCAQGIVTTQAIIYHMRAAMSEACADLFMEPRVGHTEKVEKAALYTPRPLTALLSHGKTGKRRCCSGASRPGRNAPGRSTTILDTSSPPPEDRRRRAFTLIELLVVIAIIAI